MNIEYLEDVRLVDVIEKTVRGSHHQVSSLEIDRVLNRLGRAIPAGAELEREVERVLL